MYKVFSLLCVIAVTNARAQFYYNDILGNKQARDQYLNLKKNNIKKVKVFSTDPDGAPTEGFAILQEINSRKNEMTTSTESALSPTSILQTTYADSGLPVTTTDSTEASVSTTTYSYTDINSGNLKAITSITHEPEQHVVKFSESRVYNLKGTLPVNMLRIKNGKDSLKVQFITEEHGWIGAEHWIEKGKIIETYYYYYDARGNLTDIARYNTMAKRLLPDYTFEYDENGRQAGMTAFVNGTNQYRIWRYTYDERGFKIKEVVFNKDKQPEGKVIYNYE